MVSRHFARLAEQSTTRVPPVDQKQLTRFLQNEAARQKQLAAKQARSIEELELLTDALQLCDLLSLYACSGSRESAEFPEYFGTKFRLTAANDGYKLDPSLIEPGTTLKVAALRHPATKEVSSQEITVLIN
jgi:hypothetical protein